MTRRHANTVVPLPAPFTHVQVVTIDSSTPVDKAFKILVDNHISAAPVFDKANNKYVGFFDIADMLDYIVELVQKHDAGNHCELTLS